MDDKTLELLEFPEVKKMLAGLASFSASQELALALQPSTDPAEVALRLRQSAEARRLLSLAPHFSIGNAHDVRQTVHMASLDKVLYAASLLEIKATLAAARQARSALAQFRDKVPGLWDMGQQIVVLSDIEDSIERCISDLGEVQDSASPRLADIRREALEVHQRLTERLQATIRSPRGHRIVQEPLVTIREGRYVLPIKMEHRREIKGIVHDVSDSRATVFIEPWATVELGNSWRELKAEEEHEVERILRELSRSIGEQRQAISQDVALLAQLDLALAKARYAERAKATEPVLATDDTESKDGHFLRLVEARHPLLKGKVVPLTVEIGRDFTIMVVTGPNTGGKTVALKTIGLLTAMTQAGIPIPAAETSRIPVFDGIFADIGDEQSIERALSTFSWHMGNIVRILRSATRKSLVLLDELGSSTDPNEGSALARAILMHLLSQGVMTVTTTHHSDLKVFAHVTPGLQNASLDFDPATLSPTYRLSVGYPGGSNAMAIASQLGLPAAIIDQAKTMLSPSTQQLETLLSDIARDRQEAESLRQETERLKDEAQKAKDEASRQLRDMERQKLQAIREARDKVEAEADRLQTELRNVAVELKKARSQEEMEEARRALAAIRQELRLPSWQPAAAVEAPGKTEGTRRLAVGDRVWLPEVNLWATIVTAPGSDGQVEVQAGDMKLKLHMSEIEAVAPPVDSGAPQARVLKESGPRVAPPPELDLRGKRADEVAEEVDRYLNDAYLANLAQVRIVHGFGTGVVRRMVRDILKSHALVKSFRPGGRGEGGDGATVAEL